VERLEAATAVRDHYLRPWKNGTLPPGVGDANGLMNRVLEVNRLVSQARLDLCEGKQDRVRVLETAVKELQPVVEHCEKRYKVAAANSVVPYNLARLQVLELKIALEQAKQGGSGP
jgi:hypothetical protein